VYVRRCLEQYSTCWSEADAEVIVVHTGARSTLPSLAREFPTVSWIGTDSALPPSDLRRLGFERSTRDVVLFLDDRESERHDWASRFCRNWFAWTDAGGRIIDAPTCGGEEDRSFPYPYMSVVMPVCDGGPKLALALEALVLSDLPRQAWELIVVDDGSTDDTAVVAAQYADKILRLRPGARGPGYARNRGFELTLGECIAFVNADVMVETDTLRKSLTALTDHPEIGAVFGLCDASPRMTGLLSEYRSLAQQYHRARDPNDALIFSSACGVIRSSVFEKAGGYNEWHFSRRQLEDLEIGQRIRALGERISLQPEIHATHLRNWTIRRMITTEIFDRAIPWMRLAKRQLTHQRGGYRGRRTAKNVNIAVSWLGVVCAGLAISTRSLAISLVAAACVAAVLLNNAGQFAFFARQRGSVFAAVSLPLDILYYLIAGVGVVFGWIARETVGDPTPGAVAEAFAEMGAKRWPPVPVRRLARRSFGGSGSIVAGSARAPDSALPASEPARDEGADPSQAIQ
jgi:glycosyltransferase involved in cell wall biosynthesis